MANFANLSASLNLNIQNFSQQLRNASRQVDRFAADMNGRSVEAMREMNRQTNAWGLNMKSISRVVSGILISQAFYGMTQQIRSATSAVWEFTKQLEYAHIAYSNLFGDTSLAVEFINVLKDFAAKTPFTFVEAEKAAKRLLAYGIQYENIMYVMQGVASAAAAQGDSSKVEPISRAIGQIYTYGKLMTAEVRQLTEAGIPVFDILQEKLGLTQEQLRNLGHESIPASVAINALIDGINERFGNVFEASSKTITGIISNIKDNAVMLASGAIEPLTMVIKSALTEVGSFLFSMREILELQGIGGVFEAMFPEDLHDILRQFIANLGNFVVMIMRTVYALSGLLRPILEGLIMTFNAFRPVLDIINNVLATLVYAITSNANAMRVLTTMIAAASAMWVLFKVRALATAAVTGVIAMISKALIGLSAVLTFVVAHPFWSLLIGLTGVIVGLSGGFSNLSERVNGFFKQLTKFNGIDPDKILLPSQKERANDLDKFNNKLGGTADAMDDLADSTGKAGKAAKAARGLLSFDEVFKLNEPDEGTGSGIGSGADFSGLEDALAGIGGLGGAYIPEVPDFSEYVKVITGGLKSAWEKIKELATPIISSAIGGGIGAAIGFVLGGPLGAKIGALLGALAGGLWGNFADSLGVVPTQHIATLISAGISGAVRFVAKLIPDLLKNLTIVDINGSFAGFAKNVGFSLFNSLKNALIKGIGGFLTGLAAGMLSNALTAWLADELGLVESDLKNAGIGQTVGSIIGTVVGFFVGGPIGSMIGGALGQVAGSIIGLFWDTMVEGLKTFFSNVGSAISNAFSPVVTFLADVTTSVSDTMSGIQDTVSTIWNNIYKVVASVLAAIWKSISTVWNDVWSAINTVLVNIQSAVSTVWNDVLSAVATVLNDLLSGITTVWNDIFNAIDVVLNRIWETVQNIWYLIRDLIITVATRVWEAIDQRFGWMFDAIHNAVSKAYNSVRTFFTNILSTISTNVTNAYNTVRTYFTNIFNTISTNVTNALNVAKATFTAMFNAIVLIAKNIFDIINQRFTDIYNTISSLINDAITVVKLAFSLIYDVIKLYITNSYNIVVSNIKSMYTGIRDGIADMYKSVKDGVKNMYNTFKDWVDDLWKNVFNKLFGWIDSGISKIREFLKLDSEASSKSSRTYSVPSVSTGHATGGIFDREHIARFAEGNKAEAIIPLENNTAMQPFVDAISRGIMEGLAPTLAYAGSPQNNQQLPPMYVGTLIADDRGLKQLYKKFEIINAQENARRGLA